MNFEQIIINKDEEIEELERFNLKLKCELEHMTRANQELIKRHEETKKTEERCRQVYVEKKYAINVANGLRNELNASKALAEHYKKLAGEACDQAVPNSLVNQLDHYKQEAERLKDQLGIYKLKLLGFEARNLNSDPSFKPFKELHVRIGQLAESQDRKLDFLDQKIEAGQTATHKAVAAALLAVADAIQPLNNLEHSPEEKKIRVRCCLVENLYDSLCQQASRLRGAE